MIKNILVVKQYTLTERFFLYTDLNKVNERYSRARDICLASAEKWLVDVDEIICDSHTVKHDQEMFLHHAQVLQQRYNAEPCNILYCDLDVVFVKPTRVFGVYQDFSMVGGNCGVRYYPAGGITAEQWQIQQEWINQWKTVFSDEEEHIHNWAYEQDMYNAMFTPVLERNLYQNPFREIVHNMYNRPGSSYTMIHCCGTTQKFDSVKIQQQLWDLSQQEKYDEIHAVLSDPLLTEPHTVESPHNPWC